MEKMVSKHIANKSQIPSDLINQTYTPLTKTPVGSEGVYHLNVQGVSFPVPPTMPSKNTGPQSRAVGADRFTLDYDKRFNAWSLWWIRSNGDFISVGPMIGSEEPFEDLFQTSRGHGPPPAARKEYTKAMFGEKPRLFDILKHAYSVSPSTYQCDPNAYIEGVRDAYALVMKMTATGGRGTVHQSPSSIPGILVIKERKSKARFEVSLALNHDGRYLDFAVVTKGREALDRYVAWMHHIALVSKASTSSSNTVLALPEMANRILAFMNKPSPDGARALLRYAEMRHNRGIHRVSEALNAYLKKGK
jgi:hypothetical protein